jgi:hypothetical protein
MTPYTGGNIVSYVANEAWRQQKRVWGLPGLSYLRPPASIPIARAWADALDPMTYLNALSAESRRTYSDRPSHELQMNVQAITGRAFSSNAERDNFGKWLRALYPYGGNSPIEMGLALVSYQHAAGGQQAAKDVAGAALEQVRRDGAARMQATSDAVKSNPLVQAENLAREVNDSINSVVNKVSSVVSVTLPWVPIIVVGSVAYFVWWKSR